MFGRKRALAGSFVILSVRHYETFMMGCVSAVHFMSLYLERKGEFSTMSTRTRFLLSTMRKAKFSMDSLLSSNVNLDVSEVIFHGLRNVLSNDTAKLSKLNGVLGQSRLCSKANGISLRSKVF